MKSRDGFVPLPLENNQFMASWTPVTPRKPMQARSTLVADPNSTGLLSDELLSRSSFASSQPAYNVFELDDLLDNDQMPFSFTALLSGGDHLFQCEFNFYFSFFFFNSS